jgi:CobQ/CobB/MinD/ParA nucleotide binding domain
MKPTLILVGADKGGVGKTTVSRALLDYFARKNILTRAFDTENPRGSLHRFYSSNTEIIDLGNVADQMRVLDTMETARVPVTVVDFKAGNLSYSLDLFERIGVLEAARNGMFTLGLAHVVGPSIASLDEIGEIARYLQGIEYVVARNSINETNFFEWDETTYRKYFSQISKSHEIDIPKLNEMAYEQVDVAGVTFKDFIDNRAADGAQAKFSFVLRGYVRKWCAEIDEQFARVKMLQDVVSGNHR